MDITQNLANNIDKLLFELSQLRQEKTNLILENENLVKEKLEFQTQIENYKVEIEHLKVVKALQGSEEYKIDTKAKIDFLVSEIEECIKSLQS